VPERLRDFRAQLGIVVGVALLVRVLVVLRWARFLDPQGDQNFYWRQGQDLADGFGFVYRNSYGERVATAVHPPLHSAYLGFVSFLGGDSHAWHRMASTLLGAAAVVAVGYAARRIGGNRAGIIAAALAAIYPNLWINDVMMLSESMYALTIALVLVTTFRFRDHPTALNVALLSGSVGLAALTRAEAVFLFLILVVPVVLLTKALTGRRRIELTAIATVTGALVLGPWVVRNYLTFESHPLTVSNGSGFVLEIANCDQTYGIAPPLDADGNPEPGKDADEFLGYWWQGCDRTAWPPGDETVVEAAKRETAATYIGDHTSQLPKVVAARVGRMWDLWRPGQSYDFNVFFERRGPWPTLGGMLMYYPLLIASVGGLVVLWRRRITIIPFVAIAATTTLAAAVSFGITRYRVGADVALTVLAGVALDALWRRLRRTSPSGAGGTTAPPSPPSPATDGDPVAVGAP
jgi:hypothetical protein